MIVRVYTQYSPVRVLFPNKTASFDLIANKANLSGHFVEVDSSEIPNSKVDRAFWKANEDTKTISIDTAKRKKYRDAENAAKKVRDDLKAKLVTQNFTNEEIEILMNEK